ncbi:hypothetical protein HS088_TW02G00748 [Tripterygium wilfordii]|uniref:SHSP domain-containing protein n=1 Tax=Tripterygium wilfordii TaxID=458696 RepID=A0A7J7DZM5_TRIWF|nr:alpha-crystallin domain-containing protein 22.3 [Tripterygium wilfordii]XP_038711858.1 alpha-crystallin domain-containing protein 22.3 [Tripterygium wilfordii]XP_038711865.1 alpha-crystallin domain-containing protein 22.3 [Tripterygium wilfordii]XP_038711870.1 alpha-crystallin domain-containing protein 22.3 [Tripterygium wilfordii]KAF5751731.1 hypothetical protein HS088_TW02G00748 [Tripterygium wilfordii]
MEAQNYSDHPQLKPIQILSGTAKEGSIGPQIGLTDIGESEDAYLFRVALPGLKKNECQVKCNIQRDGKVQIKGLITTTGGVLENSSSIFQMRLNQLCPPGPFTITFYLPGPVDPRLCSPKFRGDGILEVVVFKPRTPNISQQV